MSLSALLFACGGVTPAPSSPPAPPKEEHVPEQIISPTADGSARELFTRGERALLAQRFGEAKDALETLTSAWRSGSTDARELEPAATYNLAMAYEGLARRTSARDTYLDVERRFAGTSEARLARQRLFSVLAYLEDWSGLADAAARGAKEPSSDGGDRMATLAARALARVETGDLSGASRDVQDGLDLMESMGVGAGGRLPTSAAMLKFVSGEVRRLRSETIAFSDGDKRATDQADLAAFMPKMELRCAGLMGAQAAYGEAMRAQDPFFIAFGAYRVGEMYERLHRDLMAIPPTTKAKTSEQQELFFAMMHVRYRVLLEKAHDMMDRTLALAPKVDDPTTTPRDPDFSAWLKRAEVARRSIEQAIEEEKRVIASQRLDEPTVRRALEMMKEKAEKAAAAKAEREAKREANSRAP